MRAVIDRIEGGRIAVIHLEKGGHMELPLTSLGFKAYEGQHLRVSFKPDPESEKKTEKGIKDIQDRLIERTRERDKKKADK